MTVLKNKVCGVLAWVTHNDIGRGDWWKIILYRFKCNDVKNLSEVPQNLYFIIWGKVLSVVRYVFLFLKSPLWPECSTSTTRAIYLQRLPRRRQVRKAWWSEIKCRQKHRKDSPGWTNEELVRANGSEWEQEWSSGLSPPHTHTTFVSSTSRELLLPVRSSLQRSIYSTRGAEGNIREFLPINIMRRQASSRRRVRPFFGNYVVLIYGAVYWTLIDPQPIVAAHQWGAVAQ